MMSSVAKTGTLRYWRVEAENRMCLHLPIARDMGNRLDLTLK